MKKIIAIMSAVVLVICLAMVLTGCGGDKDTPTTTTNNTTNTTEPVTDNPGIVTDESNSGENGVIGDIVTDMSEMASDMMTDVSEDMQRRVR